MKKIFILLAAASMASCSLFERTVFEEDFNSIEVFHNNWDTKKYKAPGNIIYAESAGVEESGCVKITSRRPTYLSAKSSIAGLKAGKTYRVSVMTKSKNIKGSEGATIFVAKDDTQQVWICSEPIVGSNNEWQEIYVDFVADQSGTAMVCCSLGNPWGSQQSGLATGTVWYDNLKVKRAPLGAKVKAENERTLTEETPSAEVALPVDTVIEE